MARGKKRKNQKKRRGFLFKLFVGLGVLVASFFVVIIGAVLGYSWLSEDDISLAAVVQNLNPFPSVAGLPERLNLLLIGTDEAPAGAVGRADFLAVFSIDTSSGKIDIISIPRDSFVNLSADRLELLRQNGRNTMAASGNMRINEISHHAGPNFAYEFTRAAASELLGLELHHYIHVNLAGFRHIIDHLGGIEFYIPMRMFYTDPYQDLVIDLHPGLQMLSGEMAEGLVRFRSGFADADLGRIAMQQDFMRIAIREILDMQNIQQNLMAYARLLFSYTDTDIGLIDITRYITLAGIVDMQNIATHTLIGSWENVAGRFYHVIDQEYLTQVIAMLEPYDE